MENRRRRILVAAAAAVLVAGTVGGAVHLSGGGNRHPRSLAAPEPPEPHMQPAAVFENRDLYAKTRAEVKHLMTTAPDSLSPTASIPPFNKDAFAFAPEKYLSEIVPARCFQVARPGADAPVLEVGSPLRTKVSWGNAVPLWVKSVPNAPVTFTVFGGGYLAENGVATVSLRADARGLVAAHYVAGPGITGDVTVVAGSPLTSGTQRFFIRVETTSAKL